MDIENKLNDYQRGKATRGINYKLETNRYTPLCIKQINNKDLLIAQGTVLISCNNLQWERILKVLYIYMKLNHFAVDMKLIQHCKLTTLQLKKK